MIGHRKTLTVFAGVAAMAVLVMLSNFTPLKLLLGGPLIHVYHYESSDGGFQEVEIPEKGRSLEMVQRFFAQYRAEHPDLHPTLHRKFQRQLWRFWCWYDYLTHPRWDSPYRAA